MFYFKTHSPNVFGEDASEFSRVQEFRKQLGPLGVLFHDFNSTDALGDLISGNLKNLVLKQWRNNCWVIPEQPSLASTQIAITNTSINLPLGEGCEQEDLSDDEDVGLLECVISVQDGSSMITSSFERTTIFSQEMTRAMETRTREKATADQIGDSRMSKLVFDTLASDINNFTLSLSKEKPVFDVGSQMVLTSVERISALYFDEQTGDRASLEQMLPSFEQLSATLISNREGLEGFRATISSLPHMTTSVKKAKKRLLSALDDYASSISYLGLKARDVAKEIRKRLDTEL